MYSRMDRRADGHTHRQTHRQKVQYGALHCVHYTYLLSALFSCSKFWKFLNSCSNSDISSSLLKFSSSSFKKFFNASLSSNSRCKATTLLALFLLCVLLPDFRSDDSFRTDSTLSMRSSISMSISSLPAMVPPEMRYQRSLAPEIKRL